MTTLPTPVPGLELEWVRSHLAHLCVESSPDQIVASQRFRGGQRAADLAIGNVDIRGYASRRNEVLPVHRRGATALSPYVRHGLVSLPALWRHVADSPARDVEKFRDELMWQEYARHVYARLGSATRSPLRAAPSVGTDWHDQPWPDDMACIKAVHDELTNDGWLVNQTRMWAASQWTVRAGADWNDGEDYFFKHLLDGSRAANRLGWQWTIGAGTGKPYGFSRWQVQKRAPELCTHCVRANDCPIDQWPDTAAPDWLGGMTVDALRSGASGAGPAGPSAAGAVTDKRSDDADTVWITAESLGDNDPALRSNPHLPVLFIFDQALLARLMLSSKRLVFIAECLADLATRRDVQVTIGDPISLLAHRHVAVTYAPVPGYQRIRKGMPMATEYPWAWLCTPDEGSLSSYSAWARRASRRMASAQ